MAKLKVTGLIGLDGEYELVFPPYKQREWHEIKVKTGLRPLELEEGFRLGDGDAYSAIAWVTLTRAGQDPRFVWETLWEADDMVACLEFVADEDDAGTDAGPPENSPANAENGSVDGKNTSGLSTNTSLESQETTLRATGTLA